MTRLDRRIGLLFACFVLLFSVAVARAAWLQGVRGSEYRASAQSQQMETVTIPGVRGAILDRHGRELAISEDAATVFATPYQVKDPVKAARKLARVLPVPEEKIAEALSGDGGFAYVARKVDLPTAARITEMDIPGIGLLPDSRRVYPEGELAAQVIGAVNIDNEGTSGLELAHNDALRGEDGERRVTRDALGEELERETVEAATVGERLKLTIDASIQAHTEQVLAEVGETYDPQGATAIVMDPRTSEILAMANWPPADLGRVEDVEELRNLATGYTYEPGSTFKAFTVAGALEEKLVKPSTRFDLPPEIQVADRTIGESHERGYVSLTVADILAQSSNVGAVKIGLLMNDKLGDDAFDKWIKRFGFGKPTGIDYPAEERGIVIPPEQYSGSTMGNLPIGQGLAVTPIQMTAAYAAIANGGILREPRLVLKRGAERVEPDEGKRVISERTAKRLRDMLKGVLQEGGTAAEVEVPGYELAGKTGTSQKVVDGEYSESQFVASFVGFAPADDPALLVTIVVDDPKGDYYGGSVAAPAFGEIAEMALPYLGVGADG
ncbi:MAG TPA: penicillin-binding protein 2 [Solirubrobacterales bacterium]